MAALFFSADTTGRGKFAANFLTADLIDDAARYGSGQYAPGVLGSSIYAVTLSPAPAITAYFAGMVVRFKADTANAGAVSVNVNSIGAVSLYAQDAAVDLTAGQIALNEMVTAVYDGAAFRVVGKSAGGFVSSEVAIAAGTIIDAAHGLGTTPRMVRAVLVLQPNESDCGYVAGDEVNTDQLFSSGNYAVLQSAANSTKVMVSLCTTVIGMLSKDGLSAPTITSSKWKVKCYAQR
jgi:hypothetical protein